MRSVERNNLCSDSAPFCKTDQMAQMDSVPKRTAKAGQEFLHAKFGDILHCLSQSTLRRISEAFTGKQIVKPKAEIKKTSS